MENNVMNEVMENENNEVVGEMPVEAGVYDETSEPELSKKDVMIGGAIIGFAIAGAAALTGCAIKGVKAIYTKFKNRANKDAVNIPTTDEINEQPVAVTMPVEEQIEVIDEK